MVVWVVNPVGQLAGLSGTGQDSLAARAVLWTTPHNVLDLNALVLNGDGWTLDGARAINRVGMIVGSGTFAGEPHGWLLVPSLLEQFPRVIKRLGLPPAD
jgi:hypothetical protein